MILLIKISTIPETIAIETDITLEGEQDAAHIIDTAQRATANAVEHLLTELFKKED